MRLGRLPFVAWVVVLSVVPSRTPASAAETKTTIPMTAPAVAPHINGAAVVGVFPGAPLVHAIAASGDKPLTYAATGLPAGLTLDAMTGRIAGAVATAGRYPVLVSVSNAAGADQRTVTIAVGTSLALTPPMGWNSYDSFDDSVTEAEMLAQANWQAQHLAPFGWDTVVVDFRWYDPDAPGSNQNQSGTNTNLTMDANGRLQPATNRFPSAANGAGFKPLADQIHALGLRFGIHIMRGVARKAYDATSPIAGSTLTARDAANMGDTCTWNSDMYGVRGDMAAGQAWYDSLFQQYAAWGIDFVKVDDMVRNVAPVAFHDAEAQAIRNAIDKSGRAIVLSLSPGAMPLSGSARAQATANMWRMSDDFWDRAGDLDHMFTLSDSWQVVTGAGHWPDADMLPLGHLGPRCPIDGANRNTRFTQNEQVSMLSLWALLPSPLMLGANLTGAADASTESLLTNTEVLAVNQDGLGQRAKMVARQGTVSSGTEIWARDVEGGKAVGLFNHGAAGQAVSVTWAQLMLTGSQPVRDLWAHADLGSMPTGYTGTVPARGAILLLIGAGAGGADGGVNDAGRGGADSGVNDAGAGTGGTDGGVDDAGARADGSGVSDAGAGGGTDARPGDATSTGGVGGVGGAGGGAGGASGNAGSSGSAGSGGSAGGTGGAGTGGGVDAGIRDASSTGAGGSDGGSSGCACATARGTPASLAALSLTGLMFAVLAARRRRAGAMMRLTRQRQSKR
ncbi:MAG TPA: putative Ig domain-containing protein [Polyangiaceae bacterium]|nr:putative Ig domain-containing protein [Polyangiaceae bacterium]